MKRKIIGIGTCFVLILLFFGGCVNVPKELTQFSIMSFNVDPSIINKGEYANLSWAVLSASTVTIDNGIGDVALTGHRMIHPTQTTTYRLTALNATSTKTVTITIIVRSSQQTLQFMSYDDSMITDTKPNTNSGNLVTFQTRAHPGWIAECLVFFDISSLPKNVIIHSATLRLYYTRNADGNPAGRLLNLYRLTSPWNEETVTWNNQPSSKEDPTTGAYVPDHVNEWMSWDVTQDVILFQSGAAQNYGWKVVDDEDLTSFTLTYLRTKEYGENIPILQIDYD